MSRTFTCFCLIVTLIANVSCNARNSAGLVTPDPTSGFTPTVISTVESPPLPTQPAPSETAGATSTATPTQPIRVDLVDTPVGDGLFSAILFWQDQQKSAWIMAGDGSARQEISRIYRPFSWSPSQQQLLLGNDTVLAIASADGTEPKVVFHGDPAKWLSPATTWLTESVLLIESRTFDFPYSPDLRLLDLATGKVVEEATATEQMLEVVFPDGQHWLQWSGAELEIADISGQRNAILESYSDQILRTSQPYVDPNLAVSPSGHELAFWACPDSANQCGIYVARVEGTRVTETQMIRAANQGNIENLSFSPNGEYLGFREDWSTLVFLAVDRRPQEYDWTINETLSPLPYIWSPDSTSIIYQSYPIAADGKSSSYLGIVKMQVATGETTLLFANERGDQLADWQLIKRVGQP